MAPRPSSVYSPGVIAMDPFLGGSSLGHLTTEVYYQVSPAWEINSCKLATVVSIVYNVA